MNSNVVDQPAPANKDSLGMDAYAQALTEFIEKAQTPLTIALQGEWGSGKTSLMNTLHQRLAEGDKALFYPVWINTWQFALMSDPSAAILNILMGIIHQITSSTSVASDVLKNLAKKVLTLGLNIGSQILSNQIGVGLDKALATIQENASAKSNVESLKEELRKTITDILEKSPKKIGFLFFIDDLDRIDPPVAVQILELLKNIFDLDKCIFILAIDYGVVVKGLEPKFGEMSAKNEREFRSFFDKIIQLPFSMPVNNYKIDRFLMSSLADIGYLEAAETENTPLCEALTTYAINSVGTNPRSLKRLINYLSLIRLLIAKTGTQEDDEALKNWKDVIFALVSLQIQYPKIYDALLKMPDFPKWGAEFEQIMHLPKLQENELEKLKSLPEFDEPWEQMLFRLCRFDAFLEARALNVSRILNHIKARIEETKENISEIVKWLLGLSAVTNVKSEPEPVTAVENFNSSQYLKELRWNALHLRSNPEGGWETRLPCNVYLSSWQKRVQSNLSSELWIGKQKHDDGSDDGYLCEPIFKILQEGQNFQLWIRSEIWGAWPKEIYTGFDFDAPDIQDDLAKAEEGIRNAWRGFGVAGYCAHDASHIWWNVSIPFVSLDELNSPAFSEKLRTALGKLGEAGAAILPYRLKTQK